MHNTGDQAAGDAGRGVLTEDREASERIPPLGAPRGCRLSARRAIVDRALGLVIGPSAWSSDVSGEPRRARPTKFYDRFRRPDAPAPVLTFSASSTGSIKATAVATPKYRYGTGTSVTHLSGVSSAPTSDEHPPVVRGMPGRLRPHQGLALYQVQGMPLLFPGVPDAELETP